MSPSTPVQRDSRSGIDPMGVKKVNESTFLHRFRSQCNTHLGLYHSRTLGSQYAHCLEDVQYALVLHSFQNDAQSDKDTRTSHARRTVHGNGSILAKLLLGLVHLSDEVDEALARLGHTLLRPIDELELADGAR